MEKDSMTQLYNIAPNKEAMAGTAIVITIAQMITLEIIFDLLFLLSFFAMSLHQLSYRWILYVLSV